MLIVIEGIDGCGKDLIADGLVEHLGSNAQKLAFPNDRGETGPLIRSYLSGDWKVKKESVIPSGKVDWTTASAMVFQALQVTNRMESMMRLKGYRASKGKHLVLSRYWQSGYVYGVLDGLSRRWLKNIHAAMVQPDLSILIDAKPVITLKRCTNRSKKLEIYEGDLKKARAQRAEYLKLWKHKASPSWAVINGDGSKENVLSQAIQAFEDYKIHNWLTNESI